jgi:putative MATE family efflux protein
MRSKLFGDKAFYRYVLILAIPILIQNFITNFVSMLDNVMVGRIGGAEMSGVAVANQLIFVFNLCVFGAISGAGIFGAQFHGNGDVKGVRDTFRFKILAAMLLTGVGVAVFLTLGPDLIRSYLKGEGDPANAAASLGFAWEYLLIMLIGLLPYAIALCYAGTLRETGRTVFPMAAAITAVMMNLVLNWLLIFDHFGYEGLGVKGAAIATVISRFAELAVLVIGTAKDPVKHPFIVGAFRSFAIPVALVKKILIKAIPLMANETMWAGGVAMLNQCYSRRGLHVVEANNICQTFFNVFSVSFIAVGAAVAIIVGQLLGAGKLEEARDSSTKLITFSVMVSTAFAVLLAVAAEFIPRFYNTTDDVRSLATGLMRICALIMPLDAFVHSSYFTIRSGGKMLIAFLFDSGFSWAVSVPVAFVLSRFTSVPILPLFLICQLLVVIKCALGFYFVRRGDWLVNMVADESVL